MREKRSLILIELLVIICVMLILLGIFGTYLKISLKVIKETALINELSNIRMSIEHYRILYGKLPLDLFTLMNQRFTLKGQDGIILQREFLKPFRIDRQGYLLDPFMNRYGYDSQAGRVRSQTKGYENW